MIKSLAVLIPEGIDVDEIVKLNPSKLNADYLRYLIHIIITKQGRLIENHELYSNEEVKVSRKDSTKQYVKVESLYIGAQYEKHTAHINHLIKQNYKQRASRSRTKYVNVFDREGYVVGKKSYTYRLGAYFRKRPLKVEYIQDVKIIKAIKNEGSKIDSIFKTGGFSFFGKSFNEDLEIDLENAIILCQSRYEGHKDYNKYIKELSQIINFNNGIYRLIYKKDSIGRFYTNITQLAKVYRKFITYNGKRLVEVDISNSVIFYLGILLCIDITLYNINEEDFSILLMFSKFFESVCGKEKELIFEYGKNGNFYDLFVSDIVSSIPHIKLKRQYEKDNEDKYIGTFKQQKKVTKKLILSMLFAEHNQYLEIQSIFQKQFPEFLKFLNLFKLKFGHKKLAHILFRLEAHFITEIVAKNFNRKYGRSNIPIFSLHDCLITIEDYKDELIHSIAKNHSDLLGCAPNVKEMIW